MTKYCKGCGVLLQNEDENALGYVPTLDASYVKDVIAFVIMAM